jgi:histone deacetylase 11
LVDDPLGKLQISKETVIERDAKVIGMCRSRGIPVVMLLSGGYQPTNADIIAESLANLLQKFH